MRPDSRSGPCKDAVKTNKKNRKCKKRFERNRKVKNHPLDIGKEREYLSLKQFHTPKYIGSDRGAADKSTLSIRSRDPGQAGKGMPPKWEPVPVPASAGSSDKICRTVTYVERYRGNQQADRPVVFADFSRNASQEHYDFFTAPVVLIVKKQAPCFEINTDSERNMTMNIRRLTASLLAAVTLLALTACGAPADNAPAQEDQTAAENQTTTESNEFRVGMECAYAPSNWQESEASDTNYPVENVPGAYAEGYDVQIAKIIANQLGKELVIVKLSWDGLIDALNQGQIDAIIAGMMDTAERRESINFTEPYKETIYSMMVLADSPYVNATSIQDFSGAAVLGQQGTALDEVIDQIEGVDHLSPVGSVPDMMSRLQQGTCDAIVINQESAPGYLASNPDFRLISFADGNGFTLPAKGSCVGLRKSDTDLMDQINAVLATIDNDTRLAMWDTAVANQPQ